MRGLLCVTSLLIAVKLGSCRLNTTQFHTWETIDHYMHAMELEHPFIASVGSAGFSFEGRPIRYMKLSSTAFKDQLKPVIFIDALSHANEWITAPVVTYIIDQLISKPDQELLKRADWILMPVVNPDGYVFSYTWDRFWSKTRSESNISRCIGVDVVKNFDFRFTGRPDDRVNPCSDDYRGETPFSESESRAVRDIMLTYSERLCLYLTIQAWGSKIIYPFDSTLVPKRRIPVLLNLGLEIAKAIRSAKADPNSPNYEVGNSIKLEDNKAAFFTTSYAMSVGIPLAFQIVLPGPGKIPDGRLGLLVHSSNISGIVKETWAGIQAGASAAIKSFKTPTINKELGLNLPINRNMVMMDNPLPWIKILYFSSIKSSMELHNERGKKFAQRMKALGYDSSGNGTRPRTKSRVIFEDQDTAPDRDNFFVA